MSSTLYIRHLSSKLSTEEREDFLRHFGAYKVWFLRENSNTAFAQFATIFAAEQALHRLHQLEILGKRLIVEYASDRQKKQQEDDRNETHKSNHLEDALNSWNPSLKFLQPPPPHLKYKYPSPTPSILFNIVDALLKNNCFYSQTLHLMNKMCLDPPFGDLKEGVKTYIKQSLHHLGVDLINKEISHQPINQQSLNAGISSEESEISSDENVPTVDNLNTMLPVKRKSKVKRTKKIPKLSLQMKIHSSSKNTKAKLEDVFEEVPKCESKKIELKVISTQLNLPMPRDDVVTGEIGKMAPLNKNESEQILETDNKCKFVSLKELLENKICLQDMKVLPVFKNYHPGVPSTKLYIKNLSKDVEVKDLELIYKRYIENCDLNEQNLFDIRLMQEGRMKGQAFISFPNVELCERALNETNGFILKSKPLVVQFGKISK